MFFFENPPPGFPYVLHGPAVDIGPSDADDDGIEHIKQKTKNRVARAHVFEQDESPVGLADPAKFLQALNRVGHGAENERGEYRVERLIQEA